MSAANILIAGIGNIFLGDDAFGSEVARWLMGRSQPPGVRVMDFGIRGLDLTYALADGCDLAILVDAMPRGGTPGTVYVLEPQLGSDDVDLLAGAIFVCTFDGPDESPLRGRPDGGAAIGKILIVGCEPTPIANEEDDMNMEMSPSVSAAIDQADRRHRITRKTTARKRFEPAIHFPARAASPAPGPKELAL